MKNITLVTVLYIISRVSYRFIQLAILLAIISELFISNGKIGNFHNTVHHSKGYPLTTRIQLNTPDTLINYKNANHNGSGFVSKSEYREDAKEFNKIHQNNNLNKTYQINQLKIYGKRFEDLNSKIEKINIQDYNSEVDVIINPKDVFFKSILILKTYLKLLLLLFITHQCMHLFLNLKNKFAFDIQLNRKIRNIGYSLIVYQSINMIASFIVTHYIWIIEYQHFIPNIKNSMFKFMSFTPVVEYNWKTLFLGLCLIVVAKLLNYGYDLQNENELTI